MYPFEGEAVWRANEYGCQQCLCLEAHVVRCGTLAVKRVESVDEGKAGTEEVARLVTAARPTAAA